MADEDMIAEVKEVPDRGTTGGTKKVYRIAVAAEITDLNAVDQTFKAVGYVRVAWATSMRDATSVDFDEIKDVCPVDPGPLLFLNALETTCTDSSIMCKNGQTYMTVGYEALFGDVFRLQRFPFDRQLLSMVVQTMVSDSNIEYQPLTQEDEPFFSSAQTWFGVLGGAGMSWVSFDPIIGFRTSSDVPNFEVKLRLQRKPQYYIINVSIPLFLLVILSGLAFFLPPDDLPDRLAVVMTLILAAVAFKFVITSYLPKVPYVTLLDTYVIIAFVFLAVIALENALVYIAVDHDIDIRKWDILFAGVVYGCWVLLKVLIMLGERTRVFYEDWEHALNNPADEDPYRYASYNTPMRDMTARLKRD